MKSYKNIRPCLQTTLFIPALAASLISVQAHAATLTVTNTSDSGVAGCTSAGTGDGCTLREAIIAANTAGGDDTINATGISGVINLVAALPVLRTNIVLNGPGPLNLTVQRSSVAGTPEFRIFTIDNTTTTGPTIVISGLTLSGGRVSGASAPANYGGAIYNNHGTLTIDNSIFRNNAASFGGAICNDGSLSASARLTLSNSSLTGNTATGGGAIFNNAGGGGSTPLAISNCILTGNRAVAGGAILNDGHAGGSATITELSNSVVSSNTASGNGGAINNDGRGGSATLTATNSTFNANTAAARGCVILNTGTGAGSATVEIDNSTLKGNALSGSSVALDSDGTGGSATLALGSTILANAPATNIVLTVNSATKFTSKNNNLSGDRAGGDATTAPGGYLSAGNDKRNTNPMLDTAGLKNNGGPTQTIALLPGSPAINAGSAGSPTTDQRSYTRVGVPDIGAYEFGGVSTDQTAPAIAIATPGANAVVNALPAISGTASDNIGVVRVDLYLQRKSDNKFWNGTTWTTSFALSTAFAGTSVTTWSRNSGLPTGANLSSGLYFIAARAIDAAGNGTSATRNFTVDTIAPTIAIATPANNATVSSLPSINGTAADNTGVVRVDLYLQRKSDNKFWNGTTWTTSTAISTVLSGAAPRQWTRNSGLPTGANLLPGAYFVAARAYDTPGNGTSATINFSVAGGASVAAPSPIQLSSAIAGSDGTIKLTFTGALGAGASDAANYSVSNNERAVAIATASQPDASTVELSVGSLAAGSRISVSYDVQDAQGRAFQGTTTVVVK